MRATLIARVDQLQEKVETPLKPFDLQEKILSVVQSSMHECMKSVLVGYQSPLNALIVNVVGQYKDELTTILKDAFGSVIRTEDFKQSILNGLSHKLARSMIAGNDSAFEKITNDLKQDHVFRARLAVAVANVVEEILKERKGE